MGYEMNLKAMEKHLNEDAFLFEKVDSWLISEAESIKRGFDRLEKIDSPDLENKINKLLERQRQLNLRVELEQKIRDQFQERVGIFNLLSQKNKKDKLKKLKEKLKQKIKEKEQN